MAELAQINFFPSQVPSTSHDGIGLYQCKDGYVLKGPNTTKCHFGNWTEVTPSCELVYCPFPGYIDKGKVSGDLLHEEKEIRTFSLFRYFYNGETWKGIGQEARWRTLEKQSHVQSVLLLCFLYPFPSSLFAMKTSPRSNLCLARRKGTTLIEDQPKT